MDKGGIDRLEAEKLALIVNKAERKEYGGMFEAAIESIREDRREAWEEGREEGREENRKEIAANLKHLGVSAEIIAQATGLNMEEIR